MSEAICLLTLTPSWLVQGSFLTVLGNGLKFRREGLINSICVCDCHRQSNHSCTHIVTLGGYFKIRVSLDMHTINFRSSLKLAS